MRRILCIGGHDFTGRPEDRAITDLIASLAGSDEPNVCLLPTASGDAAEQSARFFGAFAKRPIALRDHLLSQDLIYVGGGSMVNLLAVWEAHDLGSILRLAWENGTLICGQSAGAMCWFEVGVTKGSGATRVAAGLGVLPGSASVHYHSEPERRRLLLESIEGGVPDGYGIDDHAALLWTDRELTGVYSARRGATAYRVEYSGGRVVESPLAPTVVVPRNGVGPAPEIAEFRRSRRAMSGMR
jgi:dipeptidase E